MREIKFRFWNAERKIMMLPTTFKLSRDLPFTDDNNYGKVTEVNCNGENHISFFSDAICLMQYIGKKDKKGKEIYEGDILSFLEGKYKCIWATQGCMFTMAMISKVEVTKFLNPDNYDRAEIIGNIYENPDKL